MPRDNSRLVYSTDSTDRPAGAKDKPGKGKPRSKSNSASLPKGGGVRVMRTSKGRGGKTVTVVCGLQHDPDTLKRLGKELKQLCGTGGTVKDGEIVIQGDHRDSIVAALNDKGYNAKAAGG
jgi:translation initiation factor 1